MLCRNYLILDNKGHAHYNDILNLLTGETGPADKDC